MFSEIEPELSPSLINITLGVDIGVGLFDASDPIIHLVHCRWSENIRAVNVLAEIKLFEASVEDFVVFLENFGEASTIQLDVGFEFRQHDIHAYHTLLEGGSRVLSSRESRTICIIVEDGDAAFAAFAGSTTITLAGARIAQRHTILTGAAFIVAICFVGIDTIEAGPGKALLALGEGEGGQDAFLPGASVGDGGAAAAVELGAVGIVEFGEQRLVGVVKKLLITEQGVDLVEDLGFLRAIKGLYAIQLPVECLREDLVGLVPLSIQERRRLCISWLWPGRLVDLLFECEHSEGGERFTSAKVSQLRQLRMVGLGRTIS